MQMARSLPVQHGSASVGSVLLQVVSYSTRQHIAKDKFHCAHALAARDYDSFNESLRFDADMTQSYVA